MTVQTRTTEPAAPPHRGTGPGYWGLCVVVALGVALLHFLYYRDFSGWMTDMRVYTEGSRLSGAALYTQPVGPFDLYFQYPPFIADLFRAVAGVDVSVLGVVVNAGGLLALNGVLLAVLRRTGVSPRTALWVAPLVMAGSPLLEPVDNCLQMGQVDLLLMGLVVLDVTVLRHSRWSGIGIGLAAGIKLVPAVFVLYLLLTRRYRAAATATATFVAVVAAGFLTRPAESRYFWTHLGSGPHGAESAQIFSRSSWSVLVRATGGAAESAPLRVIGLVLVVLLTAAAVLAVVRVRNRLPAADPLRAAVDVLGVLVLGLAAPLLLRISWVQYWVWLVPALAVALRWAWLHRSRAGLVGLGAVLVVFTFRFHSWGIGSVQEGTTLSPLQNVQTGLFPVATLALLLVLAHRLTGTPEHLPARASGPA